MKKIGKILEKHYPNPFGGSHPIYDAMREYAHYCCRQQKMLCANRADFRTEEAVLNAPFPTELKGVESK